jgi:uncharacterized tellurite resistance protein B-like protein
METPMSILEFLGFGRTGERTDASESAETETVRKIVDRLDHLEPERARFVAAFAYILSRVAHADLEISAEETRAMERIVTERGQLPSELAVIVVQMAKTQNLLFGGTENYLVTREMNRIASRDQKVALLDCLFAVSAADESVTTIESNVMRQIAAELRLGHRDFITVRARYRDHLAVLKKPDASTDKS